MSDIIERLRACADTLNNGHGYYTGSSAVLDREAADEIERFRAALATARATALEEAAKAIERAGDEAMAELSSGSDNSEYRAAHDLKMHAYHFGAIIRARKNRAQT